MSDRSDGKGERTASDVAELLSILDDLDDVGRSKLIEYARVLEKTGRYRRRSLRLV